jgi:hypothetical protein
MKIKNNIFTGTINNRCAAVEMACYKCMIDSFQTPAYYFCVPNEIYARKITRPNYYIGLFKSGDRLLPVLIVISILLTLLSGCGLNATTKMSIDNCTASNTISLETYVIDKEDNYFCLEYTVDRGRGTIMKSIYGNFGCADIKIQQDAVIYGLKNFGSFSGTEIYFDRIVQGIIKGIDNYGYVELYAILNNQNGTLLKVLYFPSKKHLVFWSYLTNNEFYANKPKINSIDLAE